MANKDGLTIDEKTNILFKSYMGYPTLRSSAAFYDEVKLSNHTNFLGANIMTDTPPTAPIYTALLTNTTAGRQTVQDKLTSHSSGLVVDDTWVQTLVNAGATFLDVSGNDSILRFEKLKLEYLGGNTSSFICKDLCGNNILKNLVPSSYSGDGDGYIFSLDYKEPSDTEFTSAVWLAENPTKQWGAPLFDAKNGVITCYDVDDDTDPMNIFDITKNTNAPTFYLTATKYVGAFGVGNSPGTTVSGGVWDQDAGTLEISYGNGNVIIEKNLDVSGQLDVGAVIVQNRLDVMGDVSLNGRVDISGSLYVNGVEISGNEGGGSWNNSGNNTTTGDLTVGGNLTLGGVTLNGSDIATKSYVDTKVGTSTNTTVTSGGGGSLSFETNKLNLQDITSSDPLDASAGYKSHHKSNQPPAFTIDSVNSQSSSITVQWHDFEKKFIDAFTGRAFPLSFQTYVDISYTNFGDPSDSTGGWKTIFIGKGTYDNTGVGVTPDLSFVIPDNSVITDYSNNTGLHIPFHDKVVQEETFSIPKFTQSDTFDLRVYPVNQSQEAPNYLIYTGIQLATTEKPGPVTITNFDAAGSSSIQMDLSFALDFANINATGIPIQAYEISYNQVDTRSLASSYSMHTPGSPFHKDATDALIADPQNDLPLTGLYPGAQYEVQVRAQNSLAVEEIEGEGPPFGDYGDPSNSNFTQISADQYITPTTADNNTLVFTLENKKTISSTNKGNNITLLNSNGNIDVGGTASFVVNAKMQGKSMKEDAENGTNTILATATISKKVNGSTDESISFAYKSVTNPGTSSVSPSSDTILSVTLSDGSDDDYGFNPGNQYIETETDVQKQGFVYKASFSPTLPSNANAVFTGSFPSSADSYEFRYDVVDQTGSSLVGTGTGTFYVDDYDSEPTITNPTITFSTPSIVHICGIPSVNQVKLETTNATISNFADYIIPYNGNIHSAFNITSSDNFFSTQVTAGTKSSVSSTSSYDQKLDTTKSLTGSMNTSSGSGTVNVQVWHLTQSGNLSEMTSKTSANISFTYNKIFRDNTQSYGGPTMYHFNGTNTIGSSYSPIANAVIAPEQLIYFDGKIRSGGYTRSGLSPFQDWGTGYEVSGPNYNNTTGVNASSGVGEYKWIAFQFTDLTLSNYSVYSSGYGTVPVTEALNTARNNVFKSYIGMKYDNSTTVYGRMDTNYNPGNSTAWFAGSSPPEAISNADSVNQGVWNKTVTPNVVFKENTGATVTYYLIIGLKNGVDSYINTP